MWPARAKNANENDSYSDRNENYSYSGRNENDSYSGRNENDSYSGRNENYSQMYPSAKTPEKYRKQPKNAPIVTIEGQKSPINQQLRGAQKYSLP